jgi:hypothetical protein
LHDAITAAMAGSWLRGKGRINSRPHKSLKLDAAGLTDKTIIVLTADHGDMDGAHQLPRRRLPVAGCQFHPAGGDPKKLKESGLVPDMRKRGAVRSVYDGRYVFSRYFSPRQHRPNMVVRDSVHRRSIRNIPF